MRHAALFLGRGNRAQDAADVGVDFLLPKAHCEPEAFQKRVVLRHGEQLGAPCRGTPPHDDAIDAALAGDGQSVDRIRRRRGHSFAVQGGLHGRAKRRPLLAVRGPAAPAAVANDGHEVVEPAHLSLGDEECFPEVDGGGNPQHVVHADRKQAENGHLLGRQVAEHALDGHALRNVGVERPGYDRHTDRSVDMSSLQSRSQKSGLLKRKYHVVCIYEKIRQRIVAYC